MDSLLRRSTETSTQMAETVARITTLELRPPPPPPPPPPPLPWGLHPPPPPPPPPRAGGIDLNVAAAASCSATPPLDDMPRGPGASGGVLGHPPLHNLHGTPVGFHAQVHASEDSVHHPPFPKIEFPKFDGNNPRWWRDQCEVYFEVYSVPPSMRTRFAALNFKGPAAAWLQTIQRRGRIDDWDRLCELVMTKFDKDQYEILLRQLHTLKQTASVTNYHAEFEKLVHGVLLYNSAIDDTFFVTRFVGGLRDDIRSAILLHRPRDVDSASALALIQEQEIEGGRAKSSWRDFTRGVPRAAEKGKSVEPVKQNTQRAETDDKLAGLKSYRRRNGLCFKCGEKWSPAHTCPPHISLHVLEEILDALDIVDTVDDQDSDEEVTPQQEVLAVMPAPNAQKVHRQTLKLLGQIGKHKVLILVDSGSIGTFVSEQLVKQLKLPTLSCTASTFRAADGGVMLCDRSVSQLKWFIQGHSFVSEAKVLPLKCYDLILGEDWLEEFSPMLIDYKLKTMQITHQGKQIQLQGVIDNSTVCTPVSAHKLKGLLKHGAVSHCIQMTVPSSQSISSVQEEEQDLSQEFPPPVTALLEQFNHLFAEPSGLPPTRPADHRIPLIPGAQPVKVRPYRYSPVQKTEIESQLKKMLAQGVIRPSTSSFASPVLLVRKKDGTWRFCIDYRHLNAITVKHKHPMPVVDELLDELAGSKWFTKLDFRSGYHQICMAAGEEYKTAFRTHNGLFEFLVMPFGLTNAPATFQSYMNIIFADLLRKGVLVFMDDILIYSRTLEEHTVLLKQVLEILQQHQFFIKKSKCSFAKNSVEYLGHVISESGVATDKSKILAVSSWPTPKSVKQLRGFLGLTGYYRKFIKHYGLISRPLTDLLKKNVQFQWTALAQDAFQTLKQKLISAPVLAVPDFTQPFVIETDASDMGVGAVLMQNQHPVAYLSKALGPRNQALSVYEKECLAILLAIEKWRTYIQHKPFVIKTDHRSLQHLTEQRLSNKLQHKAMMKMMDLQYTIQYKKGVNNAAADALSRCEHSQEVQAISECIPAWIQNLKEGYDDDDHAKKLMTELTLAPNSQSDYVLQDGVIRFKGRVWVGNNRTAQHHILVAMHDSGLGGHSGTNATYARIKQLFAWPNMKQSVQDFVKQCQTCQQAKTERINKPGLLDPLPIPEQAWEMISMDFVEGLPNSDNFNALLVVIDKLTKYGHFIPIKHPFTALQVAQLFMNNVYKLHGLPKTIISDRDRVFTSAVWQQLFRLSDTKLMMSSSYHPQTDGQTERLNQCVEGFLRCTVHSCPRQWSKWISVAEFWYNTSVHSALGKSPFEVLYGYTPRQLGISNLQLCTVPDLEQWLTDRELLSQLIKQQLARAQQRMKSQADKHRTERVFKEGDSVFLKLQPYVQSSVANRSNQKLSFRYYGPYKILQRVGKVAYKLELPADAKIHPVVHVSQLKPHVPSETQVSADLNTVGSDPYCIPWPRKILDRRSVMRGATVVPQLLIQWDHLPPEMATWEDALDLPAQFQDISG